MFLPSAPPPHAEGAEDELVVTAETEPASLADALEEIARMPAQGADDGFSGADHDAVGQGAARGREALRDPAEDREVLRGALRARAG